MKSVKNEISDKKKNAEILKKITKKDFSAFETASALRKWLVNAGICADLTAARAWSYAHIPQEAYYQAKILRFLEAAEKDGRLKAQISWKDMAGPYQRRGIPDVCAITGGKFFGFEVKRPLLGNTSEIQKRTIQKINRAGGIASVVSYTWEVEQILREKGVWIE